MSVGKLAASASYIRSLLPPRPSLRLPTALQRAPKPFVSYVDHAVIPPGSHIKVRRNLVLNEPDVRAFLQRFLGPAWATSVTGSHLRPLALYALGGAATVSPGSGNSGKDVLRLTFEHHGIVVDEQEHVVHFTGNQVNLLEKHLASIEETPLSEFLKDSARESVQIIHYPSALPSDQVVARVRSLIGTTGRPGYTGYHLLHNNCEHIASWACIDQWKSEQVSHLLSTLHAAAQLSVPGANNVRSFAFNLRDAMGSVISKLPPVRLRPAGTVSSAAKVPAIGATTGSSSVSQSN